jgi:hypothetical protein
MPDPSYKSETAAMNSKAKELREKVTAEAKKQNVSVPRTALDNFIDTYKKTKVGPIQRAIRKFISGINTKADYTSGKSTYAKENTKAQSNRAKSSGGRSAAQSKAAQVERDQRKLAAKSKAAGGKSVLSRKPAEAKADTKLNISKTIPKSKPKAPVKKKSMATPKSKPKMYTAINTKTGKADFDAPKVTAAQRLKQEDKYKALNLINKAAKSSMAKKGKKQ